MQAITDNSLYWAKTDKDAIIPTKSDENAGYDIYANLKEDYIVIPPHKTKLIPTGIACAIGEDYYLQVQERGSTGSKGIKYGAGVIDSGYRGEIFIAITNVNDICLYIIKEGVDYTKIDSLTYTGGIIYPASKAIAQLIVHNVPKMEPKTIEYEELLNIPSKRGTGSLGSTGK